MSRILLSVWLLGWLASAAHAEPRIAYQTFDLPNGLRVYVIEDHTAPTVYDVMWFRVGSKDEVAHRTGFAHLFEHLMFKGSTHLPDGLMDRLLESAGGWSNAFTTGDMTVYQNAASANFLETMLWADADRLAGLTDTLDQAKLDNQREVVLNERRESLENEPYGQDDVLLHGALWPVGHGYHTSTIGEVADLRAAALRDVTAFFQRYYVPNNVTMVVAGDVRFADVQRLVTKYFGWIPRAPTPVRPSAVAPSPITAQVTLDATDDVQVPKVYLAWRGPARFAAGEPALGLAADILGRGKVSRLYKRLVYDEKIAQDVEAQLDSEALGGMFQIVATAKPGVDPARLIREITEEVAALGAAPPAQVEVERAQRTRESGFLHRLEPLLWRAIQLAEYDVVAHDPAYFPKDLARMRSVTPAQIQDAVATQLRPTARVVLTIRPGKKPPVPAPAGAVDVPHATSPPGTPAPPASAPPAAPPTKPTSKPEVTS